MAANLLLYQNPASIGQSYNVASKTRISILDLANAIVQNYGPGEMKPELIASRQGENLKPIPNTSKIESIGFKESVTFLDGLEMTKKWIENDLQNSS